LAHAAIDRYLAELDGLIAADKLRISLGLEILPALGADLQVPLTKVLDTHVVSQAAQDIVFAPPLLAFVSPTWCWTNPRVSPRPGWRWRT
jgi:hypothetical protein